VKPSPQLDVKREPMHQVLYEYFCEDVDCKWVYSSHKMTHEKEMADRTHHDDDRRRRQHNRKATNVRIYTPSTAITATTTLPVDSSSARAVELAPQAALRHPLTRGVETAHPTSSNAVHGSSTPSLPLPLSSRAANSAIMNSNVPLEYPSRNEGQSWGSIIDLQQRILNRKLCQIKYLFELFENVKDHPSDPNIVLSDILRPNLVMSPPTHPVM
jgi:hypothetical protein